MDVYEIVDRVGYDAAPVEAADRDRLQAGAQHLLAAIAAIRDAHDSVALSNAANDFSAGIMPLLEAVFDCGDFGIPSLWAVEEHLVRYVAGKEDDLPDFTTLGRVLAEIVDNVDGLETEEERALRHAHGVFTSAEAEWQQEIAETERRINAQLSYDGRDD
jgi:hypothetical protein